tara:strand:+ start:1082 stop:1546 length:465 start_codon:yes stop_codon:yes gene_type:complete
MPSAFEIAWLIPLMPLAGGIFIGALLISFNRTMNRLSKPVAFILISCISISALISYLILSREISEEIIKVFYINWNTIPRGINIHIDFIIDKLGSIIVSFETTLFIILMIIYNKLMYRKSNYVLFFIILSIISSIALGLSLSQASRDLINGFIA